MTELIKMWLQGDTYQMLKKRNRANNSNDDKFINC